MVRYLTWNFIPWLTTMNDSGTSVAQRYEELEQYDFEIQYKSGKVHANADALSRIPDMSDDVCAEFLSETTRNQVFPQVNEQLGHPG